MKTYLAEVLGTFLLVFIGTASVVTGGFGGALPLGQEGIGLAFGIGLIAAAYAIGPISGAHLNPAVTLGFWALGRVPTRDVTGYLTAQLAGGLAGALVAQALLPHPVTESIGGAVTHPSVSPPAAVALEAAMTALLLGVVFAFASSERRARWTPLAIVPVLTAIIWLGSPWTGASLNPARSEGPAIAFGDLADLWIYLAAPAAAALLLGRLWRAVV
jgi:aquaporin Z